MTLVPRQSLLSLTVISLILLVPSSDAFLSTTKSTWRSLQSATSSPIASRSVLYAASATRSTRKTKGKRQRTKKTKDPVQPNSARRQGPGRSLTEEELMEHVSSRYSIAGRRFPVPASDGDLRDNPSRQADFIKALNERPALVLNADFQPLTYLPLSLWSWQDAVKAIFSGKVQVVDVYPDISIRAASLEIPLPSVIALTDYVSHKNQRPAFTRRNVFLRDEYKCQYCNNRFHTADLSLDHVHPRCMGGELNWENAVTSCLKCNGRKGSMPVSELRSIGMRLIHDPRCPSQMELAAKAARMVPRRVHPTWKPYMGIAEKPVTSAAWMKNRGDEEFIDDRYFEQIGKLL